jgi:hypothetical protein
MLQGRANIFVDDALPWYFKTLSNVPLDPLYFLRPNLYSMKVEGNKY